MVTVENTPNHYNMVACTLCSCYPWPVLDLPPVWYKSAAYRYHSVLEPRKVLANLGVALPESALLVPNTCRKPKLGTADQIHDLEHAWEDAAARTPHGQPIVLEAQGSGVSVSN